MSRVLLAMSGGVDSSAAACLLQKMGFEVVGCTMVLGEGGSHSSDGVVPRAGRCCSTEDVGDARRVAGQLGFPHYVLDLQEVFEEHVIRPFVTEYLKGRTPIPCTHCNSFLKFDYLMSFGESVGISRVATGHYARIVQTADGEFQLLRGKDLDKDQSYYLFGIQRSRLARIVLPVGDFTKSEVRQLAAERGLRTAAKAESQEICFVPDGDYAGFIDRKLVQGLLPVLDDDPKDRPGPILFKDGARLGTHGGLHRFTVGQRKGLGIAHPRPLYVLSLDLAGNAVIVGYKEDAFRKRFPVESLNWLSAEEPECPLTAEVRIRSNHSPALARIYWDGSGFPEHVTVEFETAQLAVTPGQAAVFYQGDRVLGGGWIASGGA